MGKLTYQRLYWGDAGPPIEVDCVALVDERAAPAGEVAAISYAARKNGDPRIYRHPFDERRDEEEGRNRCPYLLVADRRGEFHLGDVARGGLAFFGVDLELANGERVVLAECWVVTDDEGSYCDLAFSSPVPVALEQVGQFVTEDGIEG